MAIFETQRSPEPESASMYKKFSLYVIGLLLFGLTVGYAARYFAGASAGAFDPKVVNAGDTGWVLTASALVMLMTPIVGLFYAGMVTSKNAISLIKQTLLILAVISVQWVLIGYSLVFGDDFLGIIGGLNFFGLSGVGYAPSAYAPTIPQLAFMIFQAMGAVIAPALILGSIVERIRFRTLVLFVLLWSTFVYDPVAHWVVGNGGWLHNLGALDFAGGTFVHAAAGFSGLAAAIVIGERRDYKMGEAITAHNIPFVLVGAAILWFGWLGFNGGSALAASPLAVNAIVVTNTSGAAGALVWMLLSWVENKKPSAMSTAIGAVCGLIAITPASGYVGPMASIAIGTIAGVVTYLALHLRSKYLPIDDTLDVWAAHGMGGVTGLILTGVFAEKAINAGGNNGLFFGNPDQFGIQILAAFVTLAYAFVMTVILLKLLKPLELRVSQREEEEGLDLAVHGEEAYNMEIPQRKFDDPAMPEVMMPVERIIQQMGTTTSGFPLQLGDAHNQERLVHLEAENDRLHQRLEAANEELLQQLHVENSELRYQLGMTNSNKAVTSGLRTGTTRQFAKLNFRSAEYSGSQKS